MGQHQRSPAQGLGIREDRDPAPRFDHDLCQPGRNGGEVNPAHPTALRSRGEQCATDPYRVEYTGQAEVGVDVRLQHQQAAAYERAAEEQQPDEVPTERPLEQQPQPDQRRHVPCQMVRGAVDHVPGPQSPHLTLERGRAIETHQAKRLRCRGERQGDRRKHQRSPGQEGQPSHERFFPR